MTAFNFRKNALEAARWTGESLAGVSVVYSRGTSSINDLSATIGRTTDRSENFEGVSYDFTSVDWIVTAASLVIDSAVVKPLRGDLITWNDGTTIRTYEVVQMDDDRTWQPHDEFGVSIRIHSKLHNETSA